MRSAVGQERDTATSRHRAAARHQAVAGITVSQSRVSWE